MYIDIDNTIVNFTKQAVKKFNELCGTDKKYEDVIKYDFTDLFPDLTQEKKREIYLNNFYKGIEKYENVDEALKQISKMFKIVFVTRGSKNSLQEKEEWLKNNLDKTIKYQFIGLPLETDKSSIDMKKGIIIDDQVDMLKSSNADMKILYADKRIETEWNDYLQNIDSYIVQDWNEILEILTFIKKVGVYTND